MAVIDAVKDEFPELNEDQLRAISTTEGPLLVVAGPGSGKTLVLVVRTLNLLLQGLAEPREILLCTFTEKAAFELRDRLLTPQKVGYQATCRNCSWDYPRYMQQFYLALPPPHTFRQQLRSS